MHQCEETIIFPFPSRVAEIRQAADAYLEQYDVIAHIWIRGHVRLKVERERRSPIGTALPSWMKIWVSSGLGKKIEARSFSHMFGARSFLLQAFTALFMELEAESSLEPGGRWPVYIARAWAFQNWKPV